MGRQLLIEIINQIKLRLDLNKKITYIAAALKLLRTTIYKF